MTTKCVDAPPRPVHTRNMFFCNFFKAILYTAFIKAILHTAYNLYQGDFTYRYSLYQYNSTTAFIKAPRRLKLKEINPILKALLKFCITKILFK